MTLSSNSARLAASGLFLSTMALALSACGGSDNTTAPVTVPPPVTTPAPVVSNQLYTETNETANALVHLVRNADGSITIKNRILTGGAGLNGTAVGTTAPAPDSLGSQHSVIVSADKTTLFAVNAGDASISVFSIDQTSGDLTLKKTSKTLGSTPTSLAFNAGILYVMFQSGADQVGAYTLQSDGSLSQIGLYPLPAGAMGPTQIVISPDNNYLVASAGPGSNNVAAYPMNKDGSLGAPVSNTTASAGITNPFAGAFVSATLYLESDVTGAGLGSYSFSNAGALKQISSVTIGQPAPCWLVISPDGKFAYVGNGAGTISSLSIGSDGKLALVNAKAASEAQAIAGVNAVSSDSFISPDGKFLYSAYIGDDKVVSYSIAADGSLTKLNEQVVGTATKLSLQGLAGI
jgi:6-phosphogluconolactonase (cycloisomerase 2 family)